jgi:hypothetical protein
VNSDDGIQNTNRFLTPCTPVARSVAATSPSLEPICSSVLLKSCCTNPPMPGHRLL